MTAAQKEAELIQGSSQTPGKTPGLSPVDELMLLRDPFKMPQIQQVHYEGGSDLERFEARSFKVIGILTGPERLRALLLSPEGRTYAVGERTKIGQLGGSVRKIYEDRVLIQEKSVGMFGKAEVVDIELSLAPANHLRPR
jgi:Tfp pilus assembly protein PilP